MENNENKNSNPTTQTPAFAIALIGLFIVFLVILANLPFPKDYGFWPRVGIGLVCLMAGCIIYSIAVGIIEVVYKIIVEISAALLLFGNVVFAACLWAYFKEFKGFVTELGLPVEWKPVVTTIVLSTIMLLIFNLASVYILYPMARVANTKLDLE